MQTFLPYPDLEESARALDDKRLGKQRVETLQIYRALTREKYGWQSHPAVLMWRGYEEALVRYGLVMVAEWRRRGYGDTVEATLLTELGREPRTVDELARAGALPPWLGDEDLHRSHRAALARKDPDHYCAVFGYVPEDEDYHWPGRAERIAAREKAKAAAKRERRAMPT